MRSPLGQHAHDLRDHIPGASHDHGIPAPHVLALDLVHIVQRRVADRDAGHLHGLEPRDRREHAGAAHLEFDRAHHRELLIGGKLVRDRPTRRARDHTEQLLLAPAVDLVDHAVDLIGERGPTSAERAEILKATRNTQYPSGLGTGAQAPGIELFEQRGLGHGRLTTLPQANAIEKHL